jgi:hypothetical protein
MTSLSGAIFLAIIVPSIGYLILSQKLKKLDAAAVLALTDLCVLLHLLKPLRTWLY